jgi:hypothetical protein
VEAVLAPAESIFELMQVRNGQTPATVARHIEDRWGSRVPNLTNPLEPLRVDIQNAAGDEQAEQIVRCDRALSAGKYEDAIQALLEWNRIVMSARGSAPWVNLSGGKLDVRYRRREGDFPSGDELPELWRNSYFIHSLMEVTFQLERAADAEH